MDTEYGLIFKDEEGDVWIGKYENSTIREFNPLSDFEGFYDDLELAKFAFVAIQESGNEQVWIKDICTFEVGKRNRINGEELDIVPVTEMLKEVNFPSEESDDMFVSFLTSAGKAN